MIKYILISFIIMFNTNADITEEQSDKGVLDTINAMDPATDIIKVLNKATDSDIKKTENQAMCSKEQFNKKECEDKLQQKYGQSYGIMKEYFVANQNPHELVAFIDISKVIPGSAPATSAIKQNFETLPDKNIVFVEIANNNNIATHLSQKYQTLDDKKLDIHSPLLEKDAKKIINQVSDQSIEQIKSKITEDTDLLTFVFATNFAPGIADKSLLKKMKDGTLSDEDKKIIPMVNLDNASILNLRVDNTVNLLFEIIKKTPKEHIKKINFFFLACGINQKDQSYRVTDSRIVVGEESFANIINKKLNKKIKDNNINNFSIYITSSNTSRNLDSNPDDLAEKIKNNENISYSDFLITVSNTSPNYYASGQTPSKQDVFNDQLGYYLEKDLKNIQNTINNKKIIPMGMKNEQLTYYKINNYIDPFVTHNPQKSDVRFGSEVFVTETIFKPTIQRSTSYYSL